MEHCWHPKQDPQEKQRSASARNSSSAILPETSAPASPLSLA